MWVFLIAAVAAVCCTQSQVIASYDNELAKSLQELNAAILCPPDNLRAWNCSRCPNASIVVGKPYHVIQDIGKDTLALVTTTADKKNVVVAFRGTVDTSLQDWLIDFEFKTIPLTELRILNDTLINKYFPKNASVHSGFGRAYMAMQMYSKPNIITTVEDTMRSCPDCGLLVTGHSLGASLSTLFTMEITSLHPVWRVKLYTFGEPRTGNIDYKKGFEALAEYTSTTVYRVVNHDDIVPQLPPRNLLDMGYYHIPREVWLHNKSITICDGSGEDPQCSASVPVDKWSANDHVSYFGIDAGECTV